MRYTKRERIADFYSRLQGLGFTFSEVETLRRAEMTLSRWGEAECNGEIERNEETGKPERVSQAWINGSASKRSAWPVADREKGALARVAKLMESHPDFVAYHQGDPRGCSLYLVRKSDIRAGETIDAVYSRGWCCNY